MAASPAQNTQPELYRSLQGHNDGINTLSFNSNSKQLASASSDHHLYLWNLQAKNIQAKKLKGHAGAITEVAFSPSGSMIATASMDNTVRIWSNSPVDNYPSTVIRSHNGSVKSVGWSPDSRFIVSGADDKTVKIYNVDKHSSQSATKKFVKSFLGHTNWVTTVRFGSNGRVVASGGTDRVVNLWDVESGSNIFEFRDHAAAIKAVRFLPESNCSHEHSSRFGNLFGRQNNQDL